MLISVISTKDIALGLIAAKQAKGNAHPLYAALRLLWKRSQIGFIRVAFLPEAVGKA